MKSKIMTLYGHYAGGSCNWVECKTPGEWDLLQSFQSIDELMSESTNSELIDKTFILKKKSLDSAHFYNSEYTLYKTNVRDDKPLSMGKDYYLLIMMIDKGNPVLAINMIGPEEHTIDEMIEQLSQHTPINPAQDFTVHDIEMRDYLPKINGTKNIYNTIKEIAIDSVMNLVVKRIEGH